MYASTLHNGFVNYDDPDYVTANAHVGQGLTWNNIRWAFTATVEANWHPLTWISHMADVQFFGLNPAGHHLTSVLFHVINVVLLFLLFTRATGYTLRGAVVAGLFAVHPLNVESVAWVAERKSLLCTLFFLLALWAYGWYARNPGIGRYVSVALLFALGLMAKPMVITLPFVLLLLDYWPLQRLGECNSNVASASDVTFLKLFTEKLPLFAMAAASALITVYAQHRGGALGITAALPFSQRIKNAIYSYLAYIFQRDLAFTPGSLLSAPGELTGFMESAGCGSSVIGHYRAGLAFQEEQIPRSGLALVSRDDDSRDRHCASGPPGDGRPLRIHPVHRIVCHGCVAGGGFLCPYQNVPHNDGRHHASRTFWLCLCLLYPDQLLAQQLHTFSHALQVTSNNGIAEDNLGAALMEIGQPELAMQHFESAVHLVPQLSTGHYNLATVLHQENQLDAAMHEYQLAITYASDPKEAAQAHNNLGILLMQRNQPSAAMVEFNAAIRINPDEQNSYLGRGSLEYQAHNLDAALTDFSRAAQIAPSSVAYFWLGRTFEDKGDLPSAIRAYESALQIAPGMNDARARLDVLRLNFRSNGLSC